MTDFLKSFSNREISIVFWTGGIIVSLFFLNVGATLNLMKSFFARKLVYIYVLMSFYLGAIIYVLDSVSLWETGLFKDFMFWVLTSGFVMLLNFTKLKTNGHYYKLLLQILSLNLFMEFIAGGYNFSLIKELVLVPVVTFFSLLVIVAQLKKDTYGKVISVLNTILSLIGLAIFAFVVYRFIESPKRLFTILNLKSFLLAPLFTVLFLPFVYLTAVYSKYESIYLNINRYKFLDDKRKKTIKRAIIRYGNFNLDKLENAYKMTNWRKPELLNEPHITSYIRNEIETEVKPKNT